MNTGIGNVSARVRLTGTSEWQNVGGRHGINIDAVRVTLYPVKYGAYAGRLSCAFRTAITARRTRIIGHLSPAIEVTTPRIMSMPGDAPACMRG